MYPAQISNNYVHSENEEMETDFKHDFFKYIHFPHDKFAQKV
jgi:hypothetical protein